MSTVTMNISLSEDLKSFVDARMQSKGFSSTSEYMRELVRRDIERQDEERFRALIEDGLASGTDPRSWDDIRAEMFGKLQQSRSNRSAIKAVA